MFFPFYFLFGKGIAGFRIVFVFFQSALQRNQSQVYKISDLVVGLGGRLWNFIYKERKNYKCDDLKQMKVKYHSQVSVLGFFS